MTFLTFIMPVRNVEPFIADAIGGVQAQPFGDWQLIIVDDRSTDATAQLAAKHGAGDSRIQVVENPSRGKVQGLNYGYSLARGDHIKFIDGDDVLLPSFGETVQSMGCSDAAYHDGEIVDQGLRHISFWRMGDNFVNWDYRRCLRHLKCLPCWTWTVNRRIADLIFPMPSDLPFEDCWMSLVVKQTGAAVQHIRKPLYQYRQHGRQDWGGVFNFDREVTVWRSRLVLRLLDWIEDDGRLLGAPLDDGNALLEPVRRYYRLAAQEECSLWSILTSRLSAREIAKLVLVKKLPVIAPWVVRRWLHTPKRR